MDFAFKITSGLDVVLKFVYSNFKVGDLKLPIFIGTTLPKFVKYCTFCVSFLFNSVLSNTKK